MTAKQGRLARYLEKFKSPPQQPKKTLGEVLIAELEKAVLTRTNEILPLFANKGSSTIRTNGASFWDHPRKLIAITLLLEFSEQVVWKDEDVPQGSLEEIEKIKREELTNMTGSKSAEEQIEENASNFCLELGKVANGLVRKFRQEDRLLELDAADFRDGFIDYWKKSYWQ